MAKSHKILGHQIFNVEVVGMLKISSYYL